MSSTQQLEAADDLSRSTNSSGPEVATIANNNGESSSAITPKRQKTDHKKFCPTKFCSPACISNASEIFQVPRVVDWISSTPQSQATDVLSRATNSNNPEVGTISIDIGEPSSAVTPKRQKTDPKKFYTPAYISNTSEILQVPRQAPRVNTNQMRSKKYSYSCIFDPTVPHPDLIFPSLSLPTITSKKDIEIFLNVHEYKPEELKVKCVDDLIIIEGKRGERMDDDVSLVSQQFTRKYKVPKEIINGKIICSFSPDGILCVTISKIWKEKEIPIMIVNKPSMGTSGNANVPMTKPLQKVKNPTQKRQAPEHPMKNQTVEEPVLPQEVEVPETNEQEHAPQQSTN